MPVAVVVDTDSATADGSGTGSGTSSGSSFCCWQLLFVITIVVLAKCVSGNPTGVSGN